MDMDKILSHTIAVLRRQFTDEEIDSMSEDELFERARYSLTIRREVRKIVTAAMNDGDD